MPTRPQVHRPAHVLSHLPVHLPSQRQAREQYDMRRGSSTKRGYGRDWQKVRAAVLTEEPLCRACMSRGRVTEAVEVHHEQPIRERPDLRLQKAFLVPLCKPCHSALEARKRAVTGLS